jgi:hypothetical protein
MKNANEGWNFHGAVRREKKPGTRDKLVIQKLRESVHNSYH